MGIVIIGSGNVAAVLGRKFKTAGHKILQVVSRNVTTASFLANEWGTESTIYPGIINRNAEVYILAVSDDAIDDVVVNLNLPGKVVAHTAASVSKDVLKNVTQHYGVFYPLQSLRKEEMNLPDIPVFFDGSDELTKKKLEDLASSISLHHAIQANDETRLKLHVAAVFVNNFTNHLYALAEEYCKNEGIEFKELIPLINETAARIKELSPSKTQTGPAARHDKDTIEKHLKLLEHYPAHKKIYQLLSEEIEKNRPL